MNGVVLAGLRPYPTDRVRPSPNWSARPVDVEAITVLVVHATADGGNEEAAEAWLCDPDSQVSAHVHLRRDGTLTRLVPDRRKAWHAGKSEWKLYPTGEYVSDLNRISLGVEVANCNDGREAYTEAQYRTLARLVAHYCRQGLALENVCGHEQIAPHRKSDPGPAFAWDRLRFDVLRLLHPEDGPELAARVRRGPPVPPVRTTPIPRRGEAA